MLLTPIPFKYSELVVLPVPPIIELTLAIRLAVEEYFEKSSATNALPDSPLPDAPFCAGAGVGAAGAGGAAGAAGVVGAGVGVLELV